MAKKKHLSFLNPAASVGRSLRHGSHLANLCQNLFTLRWKSVIAGLCLVRSQVFQKLCESAKHQRRRSAWVGQADFRKVEPNNGNHSGNCQRLSALHEKRYAREVQFYFAVVNHERSCFFFRLNAPAHMNSRDLGDRVLTQEFFGDVGF